MEPPDERRDPKQFRAEEKRVLVQAVLSLGRELIGGSKNLNCKMIFRFAKLIVGSGNIGSARKVSGSEEKRVLSREVLSPGQN
jgi:hypothetical protein